VIATNGRAGGRRLVTVMRIGVRRAGRRARVLIHGALHLFEDGVQIVQVLLGAQMGHWRQVIVLGQRTRASRSAVAAVATDGGKGSWCGQVVWPTDGAGKSTVQRHQRAANLGI